MHFIISIFVPGAAYYFANRTLMCFCVPLIGILIVTLFSQTRWLIDPYLFILMNGLLLGIHFISLSHGLVIKRGNERPATHLILILVILNVCLISVGHIYKSRLFGFELYHVPSQSMSPTIRVGDIVLTDTRAKVTELKGNDVIVFKRHARGIVLLKRIQEVRSNADNPELFVVGDNKARSQDSRSFGWVNSEHFIGIITGALFSLNNDKNVSHKYPRRVR